MEISCFSCAKSIISDLPISKRWKNNCVRCPPTLLTPMMLNRSSEAGVFASRTCRFLWESGHVPWASCRVVRVLWWRWRALTSAVDRCYRRYSATCGAPRPLLCCWWLHLTPLPKINTNKHWTNFETYKTYNVGWCTWWLYWKGVSHPLNTYEFQTHHPPCTQKLWLYYDKTLAYARHLTNDVKVSS